MSEARGSHFAVTTRRPVAILMVVVAVCVFGWVSYQRLALDLMPDISYPTLTVRTEYPGTAPEEVEQLISRPLEQELGIVSHLVGLSSISKAGQSDVILEFEWDADMDGVAQEIREKVDRVRLPEEAERPLLLRYDPSLDPIMRLGLHGPQNLYELRYLADRELKRELETVPGVAAVKVKGGLEEEVLVALDEARLALLGLDISQISARLLQSNVNLPGGELREGQTEYLIRTLNEFQSVDELAELIVAQQQGAEVRLRDIAQVARSHKDRQVITRVNGRESVELEIYKEADANIVAVARQVRNRLYGLPEQRAYVENLGKEPQERAAPEIQTEGKDQKEQMEERKRQEAQRTMEHLRLTDFLSYGLPAGAAVEVLSDQSVFIADAIREVQSSAVVGGLLAIGVLYVFLRNLLHTLIIGVTAPVSIVATFACMHLSDVSLNIMSLGGLALGVGMLVDNSIVVLESIFHRRERGDSLVEAVVRGTGDVGMAVTASTLTTVAVFFPIAFVEGVAGQAFGDMALTVVFSQVISLAVGLYLIPMLASRQVARGGEGLAAQLQASDFLQLPALCRARRALREEGGWKEAGAALLRLPLEVLLRLGMALAVLLAAVLKWAAIVLFELLWWLAKPVEHFWIKPEKTWQAALGAWAGDGGLWRWKFFDRVWPGIIGFEAPAALGADAPRLWAWVRSGRRRWLALKGLLFPAAAVFLALRLVLHATLRLAGIMLQVAALAAGVLVSAALALAGAVLLPLSWPLVWFFGGGFAWMQEQYPLVLRWALGQRREVVLAALAGFAFCLFVLAPRLGRELMPQVHQGEFNLDIALPVGAPLEKTAQVAALVEELLLAQPEVQRVSTRVGSDQTASSAAEEGEHTGQFTVRLQEGAAAEEEEELLGRVRRALGQMPEVESEVSYPALFSFKTPVEVEIRGYELRTLSRLSQEAEGALRQVPGLADVRSSLQRGNPELRIAYDRPRLAEYGLELREVAELVRHKVQGKVATELRQEERSIDVLVRLRQDDRLGPEELGRIVVNPGGPAPIPLAAVAAIRMDEGPSEIRRIDQQRAALLTANVRGTDLGTVSQRIDQTLGRLEYPAGFSYLISGQNREMEESLRSLVFALGLALFLVYVVMASQFESLVHPLVIMFTVPLALIGVIAALWMAQSPLNIMVFIGLIVLAGIVVNNAIVLVDCINHLRRDGMEKFQALVEAGQIRLRPIMMTTLTSVLGLLPMALGLGEGAELRMPLALTMIAGLTSSTFLTLVVIPVVYSLADQTPPRP